MNLQPLKALLPGRIMLVVAALLGLAVGWYLVKAGQAGDRLVQRNFFHLNQIGHNINANLASLREQVYFNLKWKPCIREGDTAGIEQCVNDISQRLVGLSPFVDSDRAISKTTRTVSIEEIFGSDYEVKPDKDGVCDLSELRNRREAEPVWLYKNRLHTEFILAHALPGEPAEQTFLIEPAQPVEPAAGVSAPRPAASDKASGDRLPIAQKILQIQASVGELAKDRPRSGPDYLGEDRYEFEWGAVLRPEAASPDEAAGVAGNEKTETLRVVRCPKKLVITYLSIDMHLNLVRGLSSPEGYFDSIIIARSLPRKESGVKDLDNPEQYHEILYNSAASDNFAPPGDVRQIFRIRSAFERFNSIFELEYEQAARREQSSGFADLAEQKGSDKEARVRPFTQSSIVPIEIGGFQHLAFVQPLKLDKLEGDDEDLVIIGFVNKSAFNTAKYSLPFNYLSLLLVLVVVGLLSFNFIRLRLLQKRGVLLHTDVYLSYASLLGVAGLVTVFLGNLAATWQFDSMFEKDKQSIAERIVDDFEAELADRLRMLLGFNARESMPNVGNGDLAWVPPLCDSAEPPKPLTAARKHYKVECRGESLPDASSLFQLDAGGKQVGYYYAYNRNSPSSGFSLERRDYYRRIIDDSAWQFRARGGRYSELDGQRFFLERIESLADTALETGISIPAADGAYPGSGGDAHVTAAATKFRTVEDVVLPPGYGFAILENHSGMVLYHSDGRRSLREHFYRATGDDAALKGMVVSRADGGIDLNYNGETVSAHVKPLRQVPWTLVVYYREPLLDIVNFHFGVTASILSAAYIFFFILLTGLGAYIKNLAEMPRLTEDRRRPRLDLLPEWMSPICTAGQGYMTLIGFYLAIAALYLGVIYYLDIFESLVWLLGVPPVIFYLWHRFTCPDYYTSELPLFRVVIARSMPIAAAFLCIYYAVCVIGSGGGLYITLASLLLALYYWFYLRPRKLNLAKHETAAAPNDEDRNHVLAASIRYYRLSTMLFVIFLAVMPTLLLQNENYDVHEKLWVEFVNWSNVDRLKARSQAYRKYADRVSPESRADTPEMPSGSDIVSEYVAANWSGVYLPRTEIRVANGAGLVFGCDEKSILPRPYGSGMPVWPQPVVPWSGSDEMLPELMTYMLVVRDARFDFEGCHPHIELKGDTTLGFRGDPDILLQVSFLKDLVKSVPILSSTGSLLESFSERENILHTHDNRGARQRTGGPGLVVMDDFDNLTGLHYLTSNAFPHTRSASSQFVLGPYLLFIVISGWIVFQLIGFLMRRQTGVKLAAKRLRLDRPVDAGHLAKSCVVVVPATLTLADGFEKVSKILGRPLQPGRGYFAALTATDEEDTLLVVKDLRSVLESRVKSLRMLDMLEDLRASGSQRPEGVEPVRVILISDIDPFYWLKHNGQGEDIPADELHRWEAQLRPLSIYAFNRDEDDRIDPSRYRQLWEASSQDERMLMAGLHHEGIVNYRNRASTISLYRRGLLRFCDLHFYFGDEEWEGFVGQQVSRQTFRRTAARYENDLWVAVRGPLLVALLVAIFFIAYVAQDEMKMVFSLFGTIAGALATVGVLSDRFRDIRSYLGN